MALSIISYGAFIRLRMANPRCFKTRRCSGNVTSSMLSGDQNQKKRRMAESLSEISSSLSALSDAIARVSSAFQNFAEAVRNEEDDPGIAPSEETSSSGSSTDGELQLSARKDSLTFQLQQSFLQMRLEGLGKPFEISAEEFVNSCMQARKSGLSMEDLQLQLILADGSLPGPFAMMNKDDPRASYVMSEEARVRAAWVRYIYVAISEAEKIKHRKEASDATSKEQEKPAEEEPADLFVKQVIRDSIEEGYSLAKLKLDQDFSGPDSSPSVRTMRQSNFLILLAFEKATANTESENNG